MKHGMPSPGNRDRSHPTGDRDDEFAHLVHRVACRGFEQGCIPIDRRMVLALARLVSRELPIGCLNSTVSEVNELVLRLGAARLLRAIEEDTWDDECDGP